MAEVAFTEELSEKRTRVFKWAGVAETDTFQQLDLGGLLGDVTIVVSGTFGTGGDIGLEGSHDETTWVAVKNPQHSEIGVTAEGYDAARDVFPFMRPAINAGTGVSVDVTVAITRAG